MVCEHTPLESRSVPHWNGFSSVDMDVNLVNDRGRSVIFNLIENHCHSGLEDLFEHCRKTGRAASLNITDHLGVTPLFCAMRQHIEGRYREERLYKRMPYLPKFRPHFSLSQLCLVTHLNV